MALLYVNWDSEENRGRASRRASRTGSAVVGYTRTRLIDCKLVAIMIDFSRLRFFLAAVAMLSLGPAIVWAHHGWAGYNSDVDTTLVVTELRLGNAHDQLTATDSDGQVWDLVLATPNRNRRLGFDESTLSVGDEIDILGRGHPSRPEIKVHCIYIAGETVYTYYDWDGTTSLSKHSDRDQC